MGVIDEQDRLIQVSGVTSNTFFAPDPPQRVKRVAALDAAGEVIWRGGEVPQPDE